MLLFVAFISSCDKEEIVFDHELPQFELRSDAILLEVIMPQGTGADEIIYGSYIPPDPKPGGYNLCL